MSDVRCAACGEPGHRYGRNEGMDRFDPQACINGLRGRIEELREDALAALRSEGWEVYRPDHETKIWWCRVRSSACNTADCLLNPRVSAHAKCGYRYLLVPVPAESEEGL